jgi:hypothetical protein
MVKKYTDEQLLERVKSLPSFVAIPNGLWIIGVRSQEDVPNVFDDKFYLFDGEKFVIALSGTTNPGVSVLKNYFKYNEKGAAIVKADEWYYNVWKYGLHKGKMPALLQLGSRITVFRDGDKDEKSEENGLPVKGWFGINFHLNTYDFKSTVKKQFINDWSAGCQVCDVPAQYLKVIAMVHERNELVSYCLLQEF